jgi:hypothetical protein
MVEETGEGRVNSQPGAFMAESLLWCLAPVTVQTRVAPGKKRLLQK